MINTIRLESIEEVMKIVTEQDYVSYMDRYRSQYYYLGLPNSEFRLQTSLRRNCKQLSRELEPSLLRSFTKYAVIDAPTIAGSVWRQLIIGRHHGLPSRLLDCSRSPLISLHFATSGESLDTLGTHDAVVWRLDVRELHSLLPESYQVPLKREKASIYTVDMLQEVVGSLEQYDEDMGTGSMVVIEPPSLDQRIINQYGNFLIVPSGIEDVEAFLNEKTEHTVRYIIPAELCWRVRDILDQMNISERIVFPGLDGLSAWLARHYYVKSEPDGTPEALRPSGSSDEEISGDIKEDSAT